MVQGRSQGLVVVASFSVVSFLRCAWFFPPPPFFFVVVVVVVGVWRECGGRGCVEKMTDRSEVPGDVVPGGRGRGGM